MLSINISNNDSSLEAVHVRIDGDIYQRIVKESGESMAVRQNETTHTLQELPGPHKHSLVTIILLRERTKYFQHEKTLRLNLV